MSSVEHPHHRVPDEVVLSMRQLLEAEAGVQTRQTELARLARPNAEERRTLAEIREASAQAQGVDADMLGRRRIISAQKFQRVKDALAHGVELQIPYDRGLWDLEPVQPEPADPTFWWARTEWSHSSRTPAEPDEGSAAHIRADWRNDGLHFFGGVTTHDGDLYRDYLSVVALFELQAERIPPSPSRLWRSTPHVELFGGLSGYTGDDDIFTGDLWSKCWMHRDQQLFQWGFGQNGPVPILLGQAHESETLIFEEDGDRSVNVGLRGFQWMPPVTFGNLNLANSLWARLEIRFDIQTEGAGSLLWLEPEVLVRTFQWPLTVL